MHKDHIPGKFLILQLLFHSLDIIYVFRCSVRLVLLSKKKAVFYIFKYLLVKLSDWTSEALVMGDSCAGFLCWGLH